MKGILIPLVILALGAGDPMDDVIRGNNRFALDLYGRLRDQPGNLFLSPYGISTALAMTYAGARGATAAEMTRTLHFDLPPAQLFQHLIVIRFILQACPGCREVRQRGLKVALTRMYFVQDDGAALAF